MIDVVYYSVVGAAAENLKDAEGGQLSEEMVAFADHLAELLAAEFVRAMKMKEENHAGGGVFEVFE